MGEEEARLDLKPAEQLAVASAGSLSGSLRVEGFKGLGV